MSEVSTSRNRRKGLIGAMALIAAIAIAIPAISSADRHGGNGHDDHTTVGTIASFDADTGTLVIDTSAGDPVTGTVDDRTRINCENDGDDDHGDDGPGHDVGDDHGDDHGDDDDGDDHGGPGSGKSHGHGGGGRGNCSTDDLTVGAEVEEAELDLTASGLVYEEIELR
jgi:hypothetical protein